MPYITHSQCLRLGAVNALMPDHNQVKGDKDEQFQITLTNDLNLFMPLDAARNKYKCQACPNLKGFAQISQYNRHVKIHTDNRYHCPNCQYLSDRRDNYRSHWFRSHWRGICPIIECSWPVPSLSDLAAHWTKSHLDIHGCPSCSNAKVTVKKMFMDGHFAACTKFAIPEPWPVQTPQSTNKPIRKAKFQPTRQV